MNALLYTGIPKGIQFYTNNFFVLNTCIGDILMFYIYMSREHTALIIILLDMLFYEPASFSHW